MQRAVSQPPMGRSYRRTITYLIQTGRRAQEEGNHVIKVFVIVLLEERGGGGSRSFSTSRVKNKASITSKKTQPVQEGKALLQRSRTCSTLSMAWTPRSRFRPPQSMLSTQETMPGRVAGSSTWVGAAREQRKRDGFCEAAAERSGACKLVPDLSPCIWRPRGRRSR